MTKNIGDRGSPLSQTTGAIEETGRGIIHQNRKAHLTNSMCYPITPFLPKSTSPQQVQNKLPIDMIIGLLNIKFAKYTKSTRSDHVIQAFISNEDGI
jgi:hypothetical protein